MLISQLRGPKDTLRNFATETMSRRMTNRYTSYQF